MSGEHRMANYGAKSPTPEERAGHWKQCITNEQRIHKAHLSTKGDGSVHWPGIPSEKEERTYSPDCYFTKTKQHERMSQYDQLFHQDPYYNSLLHREDRQYTMGLDIHTEESMRLVPVLSSSQYGRRPLLENKSGRYNRVEEVMKGFYRPRGTGIPPHKE